MFKVLDAEFALILYDAKSGRLDRRPRPHRHSARCITACWRTAPWLSPARPRTWWGCAKRFLPFPPGCYWAGGEFVRYADPARADQYLMADEDTVCRGLHDVC